MLKDILFVSYIYVYEQKLPNKKAEIELPEKMRVMRFNFVFASRQGICGRKFGIKPQL